MTEEENYKLARELRDKAEAWINTFNYIQVDVLELVAEKEGSSLVEYIVLPEITWEDISDFTGNYKDEDWIMSQKEEFGEDVEDHPDYDRVREQEQERQYPMWNTCFEFKEKQYEDVIAAAQEVGLGVIENLGDFNQILFAMSCGHSFYGSYWIPLWLKMPWNSREAEKYVGVKYDMV